MNRGAWIGPLATVVVMVCVFFGGVYVGTESQKGKQASKRLEDLTAIHEAYQERITQERALARTTIEGLENENIQIRVEHDRLAAAGRLRIAATVCDQLPQSGAPAGTDEATTRTVELPEAVDSNLRAIARDADEITAKCRALQTWVRGQYGE